MKNILITGSKGQLGNEIARLFSLYPEFNFHPADIAELDLNKKKPVNDFISDNNIDYVINCAAYTAVDKAEDDIENCFAINRDSVNNLAEATAGKTKIIHLSTDYVFDGTSDHPYNETDPVNPQSVYGKSKLEGENILTKKLPDTSMIIRTSWLYSSFGNNFVRTMIRLGKERETLNVVSDQTGTPTYAGDLAGAILEIVRFSEKNDYFPSGIYHYSNEGICSWYDFTLKIHEYAGITSCKVQPISTKEYPTKAKRPMYSVLDKNKIKKTFGLVIPEWKDSLKKMINKNIDFL